jgi:hypothetical protein
MGIPSILGNISDSPTKNRVTAIIFATIVISILLDTKDQGLKPKRPYIIVVAPNILRVGKKFYPPYYI